MDGVVEVAGGLAVDGDDREAAEVVAYGELFVGEGGDGVGGGVGGFGEDVGGEDIGQLVLADDDLDVDAEVVGVAEDLEDAAAGRLRERREVGDLDVDGEAFEGSRVSADDGAAELLRRGRDARWGSAAG